MTEQPLEQVRGKIKRLCDLAVDGSCVDEKEIGGCPFPTEDDKCGLCFTTQILNISIQLPCKECGGNKLRYIGSRYGLNVQEVCPTCKGKGYREVSMKEMIEGKSIRMDGQSYRRTVKGIYEG